MQSSLSKIEPLDMCEGPNETDKLEVTGIGFIIAAVGFGIGLACILYEWNKAAND